MLLVAFSLEACHYVAANSSDDDSRSGGSESRPPAARRRRPGVLWLTPELVQPLSEPPTFAAGLASRAAALFEAFAANATRGQGTAGVALRQVAQGSGGDISGNRSRSAGSSGLQEYLEPHHMNDAFYAWQVAAPSRSATTQASNRISLRA